MLFVCLGQTALHPQLCGQSYLHPRTLGWRDRDAGRAGLSWAEARARVPPQRPSPRAHGSAGGPAAEAARAPHRCAPPAAPLPPRRPWRRTAVARARRGTARRSASSASAPPSHSRTPDARTPLVAAQPGLAHARAAPGWLLATPQRAVRRRQQRRGEAPRVVRPWPSRSVRPAAAARAAAMAAHGWTRS